MADEMTAEESVKTIPALDRAKSFIDWVGSERVPDNALITLTRLFEAAEQAATAKARRELADELMDLGSLAHRKGQPEGGAALQLAAKMFLARGEQEKEGK